MGPKEGGAGTLVNWDADFPYIAFAAGILYAMVLMMFIAVSGYYLLFLFLFILMCIYAIAVLLTQRILQGPLCCVVCGTPVQAHRYAYYYGAPVCVNCWRTMRRHDIPWNPITDSDLEPYGPWELYPRQWEDD